MLGNGSNEDLHQRIVRSVHHCWDHQKVPALLSWLGNQNGAELSRVTRERGMAAKQYLIASLSDQVRVIQHQTKKELVGVLPIAVDVSSEGGADNLLERTRKSETENIPRFHPAFWAAFRKPLDESKHRYLTDTEPVRFRDVSLDDGKFGVEIGREYIVGLDADPSQVQKKIQDWFENNEADRKIYLSTEQVRSAEPRDLLDRVLESLESSELERVTMPLDVILKLRRESP